MAAQTSTQDELLESLQKRIREHLDRANREIDAAAELIAESERIAEELDDDV